mmetsp:Transcript_1050/g.1327  ORF Transcript_1050/g.1327 Transcript_1050/m.1327 type:complete len:303 (-) Transcript_1050:216-1124(-)
MKFDSKLLALCVFGPNLLGASAFLVKGPQKTVSQLKSSPVGQGVGQGIGQGAGSATGSITKKSNEATTIWDEATPVTVQGGSLKTWSFPNPVMERCHVALRTEGRPLDADLELWQGPDNTPMKMRVYVEDGGLRPFGAIIETPRGPNTVAVRNIGQLEFPMETIVSVDDGSFTSTANFQADSKPMTIQGGALRTYPFSPVVESVAVCLTTDGRPLNTRIELLQGPNNIKQVMEIYTEDGMDRPFFAVIETPGSGNVVRIVNTATVEFPLTAAVEPYAVGDGADYMQPVIGGDRDGNIRDRVW